MRVAPFQLLAFTMLACGGATGAVEPPKKPSQAQATEYATLLLFPSGDAEALLGRPVKVQSDGSVDVAPRREPQCEVRARRAQSVFRSTREVDLARIASASGSYAEVVRFQAKYGEKAKAAIDVTNTAVLEAETRGPCGDNIVERVFVGTGQRSVLVSAEVEGEVSGVSGALGGTVGGTSTARVVDTMSWDTEQAYGFAFGNRAPTQALELRIEMPSRVVEGSQIAFKFDANRPAYLIVYYLDAAGQGSVLWPSEEEATPSVAPGSPAGMPSVREREAGIVIEAMLATPGVPSRETLVVYAFTDRNVFDRLAPRHGESSADGAVLAARLTEGVSDVPLGDWTRTLMSYEIVPSK